VLASASFYIRREIRLSDPRIAVCTKLGTVELCEEAGAAYALSYVIDFAYFLVRKEDSNKQTKHLY
jgi:hypothetical protein